MRGGIDLSITFSKTAVNNFLSSLELISEILSGLKTGVFGFISLND